MTNDDYLKSKEYKQKYEALMERCAKFMSEFAPPSPYELGFKAGWEAAKKEFDRGHVSPINQSPIQTMDIQWPRDYTTTNPFPPTCISGTKDTCPTCKLNLSKMEHYVCYHPDCSSKVSG